MGKVFKRLWWLFPIVLAFHVYSFRESPLPTLAVSSLVLIVGIAIIFIALELILFLWRKIRQEKTPGQ